MLRLTLLLIVATVAINAVPRKAPVPEGIISLPPGYNASNKVLKEAAPPGPAETSRQVEETGAKTDAHEAKTCSRVTIKTAAAVETPTLKKTAAKRYSQPKHTRVNPQNVPTRAANSEPETFPNIGYIGRGYDIFYGNPNPTVDNVDTGFRDDIFDYQYNGKMTADQRYILPDGINVSPAVGCRLNFGVVDIQSTDDYREAQFTSVTTGTELNVLIFKTSFSASDEFQMVKERTNERQTVFTLATATCSAYDASVAGFDMPKFNGNFLKAVELLPESPEEVSDDIPINLLLNNPENAVYVEFLRTFGTHIMTGAVMGSKVGELSEVSAQEWSENVVVTNDWQSHVGASAVKKFDTYLDTEISHEEETTQTFEKSTNWQRLVSIGGAPPADGDYGSWAERAGADPMPVKYNLITIDQLLNVMNFPERSQESLTAKQRGIRRAILGYRDMLLEKGLIVAEDKSPLAIQPACRFCKGTCSVGPCDGTVGFCHDVGEVLNEIHKHGIAGLGPGCRGDRMTNGEEILRSHLCCSGAEPQCIMCSPGCGGHHPVQVGRRDRGNDPSHEWNAYMGSCEGAYAESPDASLCCKTENVCRMCDKCGHGMEEVGGVDDINLGNYEMTKAGYCHMDNTDFGPESKMIGPFPRLCCRSTRAEYKART